MAKKKTFTTPKFQVGDEAEKPGGKVSKVVSLMYSSEKGWSYKVEEHSVSVKKNKMVKGIAIFVEKELKQVK